MSILRISLLGQVQVTHVGLSTPVKPTRTVQGLLAYLLLQRHRTHPREVLAGLFWGEQSQKRARSCLNTTLWRLRQVLEPKGVARGTYLQTMATGEVGFNPASEYWLDVAVFEEHSDRALAKSADVMDAADAETLENALQLHTGELLEGFYDDWVLHEQERLRQLYLNSLARLMQYYKHRGAFEQSLNCGQKILERDPLREEIHREMMRLYLASGQRVLAVRQYQICCEILSEELGILPMEETQALYGQIVAGVCDNRGHPIPANQPAFDRQQALHQLRLAMNRFDEAREHLQQAVQTVERLISNQDK